MWLVKTLPSTPHSPRLLDEWIALDYDIVVCDPGKREVVDSSRPEALTSATGFRQESRNGIVAASRSRR